MGFDKLVAFAKEKAIDLTVIGMDDPLVGGISGGPLVEYISGAGYVAIGIHKDGSTIDGSSYPTSYTGALRITQSLYTLFLSYRG